MSIYQSNIAMLRAVGTALRGRARYQLIDNRQPERAALLEEIGIAFGEAADDLGDQQAKLARLMGE